MTAKDEWIMERACIIWEGENKTIPFSDCVDRAKQLWEEPSGNER